MAGAKFELTVQQQQLVKLRAALRAETDARKLETALRLAFRVALQPLVPEVQSGVLAYHHGALGRAHGGLSLGEAVAGNVKVGVNLGGRHAGARIYISKKGMPRNFKNAPRDLNRAGGWEHPTRAGAIVKQIGAPGYFDRPIKAKLAHYRVVCQAVMDQMAERIATRSR